MGTTVLGAACTSAPTPPPPPQPPPPGELTLAEQARAARSSGGEDGERPWFCDADADNDGHGEGGHGHGDGTDHYEGIPKGPLTWDDCVGVAEFLDKALASARRYPTRGDALAAGAMQAVQFIEGVGTHDVVPGVSAYQFDAPDPERPFYLQYDGDGPDAKLAGMSWYVIRYQQGPPPGLPGTNDRWHSHTHLCYAGIGVVIGNEISEEECERRGGTTVEWPYGWMLHAWVVPGYESRFDVFATTFGCVRGTGPAAPADDPCHRDFVHPEDKFTKGQQPPPPPEAMKLVGTPGLEPTPGRAE
jgi:hypothetical protein